MTYREIISDCLTTLKQTFDDKEITHAHVAFWVQVVVNKLKKQHADKHDTGLYLTTFTGVKVKHDSKDRKYIVLPENIFDLDYDNAIRFISYDKETGCCDRPPWTYTQFQRTTISQTQTLYGDPYVEPRPEMPYFYRVGENVFFLGLECQDVKEVELGLFTSNDPSEICDLDEDVPLPNDLIVHLIREVKAMGQHSLMLPEDRINDGSNRVRESGTQVEE